MKKTFLSIATAAISISLLSGQVLAQGAQSKPVGYIDPISESATTAKDKATGTATKPTKPKASAKPKPESPGRFDDTDIVHSK